MLYTTLSKPFSDCKHKALKTAEPEGLLAEFNSSTTKNMWASLNRMARHKHGRKNLQKQCRQLHSKATATPHPFRSRHSSENEDKIAIHNRPNFSINQKNRPQNVKRHTYNHNCQSLEREQEVENEWRLTRQRPFYKKISCEVAQPSITQEAIRRTHLEKQNHKDKNQTNKELDFNENQGQFLQPKIRTHTRKLSIHNRLVPIDFNQGLDQKPSLIDLIKKFKFENLKTSNPNCSSSDSIDEKRKYADSSLSNPQPKQKTHPFFKQEGTRSIYYGGQIHQQRPSRKPSKESREQREGKKAHRLIGLKKSNSILSPWGTVADHYFNQTPIE